MRGGNLSITELHPPCLPHAWSPWWLHVTSAEGDPGVLLASPVAPGITGRCATCWSCTFLPGLLRAGAAHRPRRDWFCWHWWGPGRGSGCCSIPGGPGWSLEEVGASPPWLCLAASAHLFSAWLLQDLFLPLCPFVMLCCKPSGPPRALSCGIFGGTASPGAV